MASQEVWEVMEIVPAVDGKSDVHVRLRCGCSVRMRISSDRVRFWPRGKRKGVGSTNMMGSVACPIGHPTVRHS